MSAVATVERRPAVLPYVDIVLVLIVAVPALAAGAPALGYAVGAAAWILARLTSIVVERRIANVGDVRHMLALGVAYKMARVWVLAIAIIVAGVAGARADGLTAALVIFGGFSVHFASSAIAHIAQKRDRTS